MLAVTVIPHCSRRTLSSQQRAKLSHLWNERRLRQHQWANCNNKHVYCCVLRAPTLKSKVWHYCKFNFTICVCLQGACRSVCFLWWWDGFDQWAADHVFQQVRARHQQGTDTHYNTTSTSRLWQCCKVIFKDMQIQDLILLVTLWHF